MVLALIMLGMIHFIPIVIQLGALGHGGGFLLVKFLIATMLIIGAASLGGLVAVRLGQPRVVGEMIAGIALGPSLLGQLTPATEHWLFPAELIPHLNFIAQMAVVAFVFPFGAELSLRLLRGSGRRVAVLGVSIVAIPVMCGILLATGLSDRYRPDGVRLLSFLLFVGVSMGVTAFPVLVRILAERGLIKSRIGTLGLTAAGVDDAIAWCLLAIAVATVHSGSAAGAIRTIALLVIFVVGVWTVLRPALRDLLTFVKNHAILRSSSIAVLVLSAVSGAFVTDWIGVHAIFGAFLIGIALPRENALVQDLSGALKRGVAVVLPLFFAVVGLKVQIDLLSNRWDLLMCGLVIVVAITSKIGTTALTARLTRLTWRESIGLGVMVNCRGLTGLVVVSTGLSLGIISQRLFVMFVAMVLVTTMMTGPLLGRLKVDE